MSNYDPCYKLLFSSPEVVRDLIRDFVPDEWVLTLDYDTLERVSGCYVTDRMHQRISDMVWRLKADGEWVYLYLLIEFQRTVDRYMAVRIVNYVTLLDLELLRGGNVLPDGRLPPVLPIVLYNGDRDWTAAIDIADLSPELPSDLARYQPRCEYLLIDANRFSDDELADMDNLVAAAFRIEHPSSDAALLDTVAGIRRRVASMPELSRTFALWISAVASRRGKSGFKIPPMDNLTEVYMSLESSVARWKAEYREAGLQEGREAGLREGLQEGLREGLQEGLREGLRVGERKGEARILRNQLTQRFGALPKAVESRIDMADTEQLETWAVRLLRAERLDDVFAD